METLNKLAGAVSNVMPESVAHTLFGDQQKQRDEHDVPTQGPGHSTYGDRPLTTTTNETGSLDPTKPLKEMTHGHKRADSGHAEYATPDAPRFGYETAEDGIRRGTGDADPSLHTTEGYARPLFRGMEGNEDGIRRADGRERVQFDSADGSSGSLRPSETTGLPHSGTQYHKRTDIVTDLGGLSLNDNRQSQRTSEAELSRVGVTVPETYSAASNSATLEEAQTSQRGGLMSGGGIILNAGSHHPHDHHHHHHQSQSTVGDSGIPSSYTTSGDHHQPHQHHHAPTDDSGRHHHHGTETYTSTHPVSSTSTGGHHSHHEQHQHHHAAPLAAGAVAGGFAAGGISQALDDSRDRPTEQGLPSVGRNNDVPREHDTFAGRQGYTGSGSGTSGEFGNISSRSGNDVGEATSGYSTGLAHTAQSAPSQGAPITNVAHVGQQRDGLSSSNEPRAQGGPVNHATTNAVPPMGGLTQPAGGPLEPSVGAHPASGVQPTQSHQGAGRPMEHPDHPAGGVPAQSQHQTTEPGHQYVRSSGLAADGGDFDAAAPGAGREADRLLEQQGVHRTDKKHEGAAAHTAAPTKAGGIVSSLLHHGDHSSSNKSHPAPHPATHNVTEPHARTGHASGGISGATHTAGGLTGGSSTGGSSDVPHESSSTATAHPTEEKKKPLVEKVKEKLHIGGSH